MINEKVDLVLDAKATLGEGAIWDSTAHRLYWVDIDGCAVHIFIPADGKNESLDTGQPVGTVVPRQSGGLAVALQHGFATLDPETGVIAFITDPEAGLPNRFNDGKCDPAGRFWAGTMPYENGAPADGGTLWCLYPDGRAEKRVSGVRCSNGIAWSLDARTLYYIDTPTMQVRAYDYDNATGDIENPRVVVEVPAEQGYPDGMTIDSEGKLWVAHWDGWQVVRWDPETGEKISSISVPAQRVTSCAFGGADLDELYITTARTGLSDSDLESQPNAGGLFRTQPGVTGIEAFSFAG